MLAGESAMPAASHLLQVDEDVSGPGPSYKLQTVVAFLCTRVKKPNIDDYKQLTRTMQFLRGTIDDLLTLEADNMRQFKWFIDASYAVHPDMKSHTSGCMMLDKGTMYDGVLTKQKLN
jgi:hypothetical protein